MSEDGLPVGRLEEREGFFRLVPVRDQSMLHGELWKLVQVMPNRGILVGRKKSQPDQTPIVHFIHEIMPGIRSRVGDTFKLVASFTEGENSNDSRKKFLEGREAERIVNINKLEEEIGLGGVEDFLFLPKSIIEYGRIHLKDGADNPKTIFPLGENDLQMGDVYWELVEIGNSISIRLEKRRYKAPHISGEEVWLYLVDYDRLPWKTGDRFLLSP